MISNDCCDNCNKNKKDNQMTPEKLEDFNKQNRKINNQPFDLVGKGHGYNTRPTFYNKEEATKSNNKKVLYLWMMLIKEFKGVILTSKKKFIHMFTN